MKNRNVQIPYELFFQLLQYFLIGELRGRRKHKERIRKETECNGRQGVIQQVQNSTNGERKRKVEAGIPGKKGNTGKLSMVEILADYFITGACHAPVNIRQGESR